MATIANIYHTVYEQGLETLHNKIRNTAQNEFNLFENLALNFLSEGCKGKSNSFCVTRKPAAANFLFFLASQKTRLHFHKKIDRLSSTREYT